MAMLSFAFGLKTPAVVTGRYFAFRLHTIYPQNITENIMPYSLHRKKKKAEQLFAKADEKELNFYFGKCKIREI